MQHKRQNLQQPKQGNDSQQQKKQHTLRHKRSPNLLQ